VNGSGIRLSVVISTWNRRGLVTQAIDSVIGQLYEGPLEIVVVDDGSTDGTTQELSARYAARTLPPNRRLIIHSKPHTGISGTMARGIDLSTGEYVSMCNSDDFWEPVRAAELLAEVEKTPGTLIHTTCKTRMADGYQLPGGPQYRHCRETDYAVDAGGYTPLEYPGNVTLRDLLPYQPWQKFYFRGALAIFPRKFMHGVFTMPQGLLFEETWFLFAAMMQGAIRYARCNSYVQRIHGQNDSLPGTRTGRDMERIRCNLVLLEHAIPVLRTRPNQDVALTRRVERRARIDRYRLNVGSGLGFGKVIRGLSATDVAAEPREILSYTLTAKAPAVHDFLARTRQSLTGKRSDEQVRPSTPLHGR